MWKHLITLVLIAFGLFAVYVDQFKPEWIGAASSSFFGRFPVLAPITFSVAFVTFSVWKITHALRAEEWGARIHAGVWAVVTFAGAIYFAVWAVSGRVGA